MNWGFISTIDRMAREFWRAAQDRHAQREKSEMNGLKAVRDAERAQRDYEAFPEGDAAARQQAYVAMRRLEAAAETARAQYQRQLREQVWADGLSRDARIPPAELRSRAAVPMPDTRCLPTVTPKPEWSTYEPEKPGRLALALPGGRANYEAAVAKARREFANAEHEHETSKIRRTHGSTILQLAHRVLTEMLRAEVTAQHAAVAEFEGALLRGEPDAVVGYARMVLSRSPYPAGFMQTLAAHYEPNSRRLVVGYDVPSAEVATPSTASYQHDPVADTFVDTPVTDAARATAYASLIAQVVLRSLRELFAVDTLNRVDTIVFNAYADHDTGVTPQDALVMASTSKSRVCLASVEVSRADFAALTWEAGDPPVPVEAIAQLARLHARVSSASADRWTPVQPFAEIDMTCAVTDADVAVDRRLNLMTLSAADFVQIMFHLLRSMLLEGAPPQASESGGWVFRAYDPHPIFGGDVIVHIKRQAAKLDAAAVRALSEEMQQTGAVRAMLWTTAELDDGVAELARDRRVEVLAGHNVVFLLKENAGVAASVVVPEGWRDEAPAVA